MNPKLKTYVFYSLLALWIFLVLIDFYNKHTNHIFAFQYFKYSSYLLGLGALFGVLYVLARYVKGFRLNGIVVISMILICTWLEAIAVSAYTDVTISLGSIIHLWGKLGYNLFAGLVVLLVSFSIGKLLLGLFKLEWKEQNLFVEVGLGLFIWVQFLFLIAALGVFNFWIVVLPGLIVIGLNYKNIVPFLKSIFLQPWIKADNTIGKLLMVLLIGFVSLNLFAILSPFPFGFDSRNYYLNLTKLIADNHALIEGFIPYPWQLFMATGFVVFDSPEVAQFFSVIGGFLSFVYIFQIAKRHFSISENFSLLIVLLIAVTPAFWNHFIVELKVDLALTFFQLLSFDLFLYLVKKKRFENILFITKAKNKANKFSRINLGVLILFGLITGFCFSIKFTHLFLLLSLMILIWTYFGSVVGFASMISFLFYVVIQYRLINMSGLSEYHLGIGQLKYFLIFFSISAFIWFLIEKRKNVLKCIIISLVFGVTCALPISPWAYKNYLETNSKNIRTLLMGQQPSSNDIIFGK